MYTLAVGGTVLRRPALSVKLNLMVLSKPSSSRMASVSNRDSSCVVG
jgi:hypothetical protein